jgi:pimeloyl-ACP methyl ester carboxylesterase
MLPTHHRTVEIEGHEIFYREAGDTRAPTIVLLHGFPASSAMFRNLVPMLADRYHVIAPDHVGFGLSAAPGLEEFDYSFNHLADVTEAFLQQLGIDRFAIYVQDYGAPIGWRLYTRSPERV